MPIHDIGIVIVNYNVRHFLVRCLQSIRNSQTGSLKIGVWVVDNASVDGSSSLISRDFPEVHLIANDTNLGFSAANNQAIKQMDTEYILLLNPDTILEEDTLQKCYNFMAGHPQAGAVGVRMIDGTGRFLPESKRQIPRIWNSFCKLTFLTGLFPGSRIFSGYNLGYLPEFETHEVEVLCGAFMFIRSSVLKETGLLDEAFFMYGEDIDLSYRILKAGHKIYYYPETSIIHYKGESTKKGSLSYVRTFYGAMDIYVNKHFGQGNARLFARVIKSAIWFRALLSGLSRIIKSWVNPLIDLGLIWLSLSFIKHGWAAYHFGNRDYYEGTAINGMLGLYAAVWVFFLWLLGQYDFKGGPIRTLSATIAGTLSLLIVYALLPEGLRTSRMMILLGFVAAFIVPVATRFLTGVFFGSGRNLMSTLPIAIVAGKTGSEKLTDVVRKAGMPAPEIHYISPTDGENDPYFSGTVSDLPAIARSLGIGEIIYSFEDLPMKEIIRSMTSMQNMVTFRIGGDESLSVIGSHGRNLPGELYSLDITYRISDTVLMRLKRLSDIMVSLIALPLSPVLFVVGGLKTTVFNNIFNVLLGKTTWVGYGGEKSDYSFLPPLPRAVIPFPMTGTLLHYVHDHFKNENIRYARDYKVFSDLWTILTHLHQMSNRVK